MRVVIQRVRQAAVHVGGQEVSSIGPGLLVLWGIEDTDDWTTADYCLRKTLNMKLWGEDSEAEDRNRDAGCQNKPGGNQPDGMKTWALSVMDRKLEILVVSQFTLFGSVKKGNKPDFHRAMTAQKADEFFKRICEKMKQLYTPENIKTGSFGNFMQVSLVNDGPVTLVLEKTVEELRQPKTKTPTPTHVVPAAISTPPVSPSGESP